MHTSILLAFTLLSSSLLLAAPVQQDKHPHLVRRQIPILDTGISAGAVDISRTNRKNINTARTLVQHLRDEVTFLKGREQMLQGGPRLQRRQLGTVLGSVGIHESKDNRAMIVDMQNQVSEMRTDVDWMLQMEHLGQASMSQIGDMAQEAGGERDDSIPEQQDNESTGPEESSPTDDDAAAVEDSSSDAAQPQLVRRQIGLILGPIALYKAHTDRNMMNALQPKIQALLSDCARIRTAQEERLQLGSAAGLMTNSVTVASTATGRNRFNTPMALMSQSGVLAESNSRNGWVTGPTVNGGAFVPRSGNGFVGHSHSHARSHTRSHAPSSAYGRPRTSYN